MRRLGTLAGIALALVACQDAANPTAPQATPSEAAPVSQRVIPGQYIVVLRETSGDFHTTVARFALRAGAKVRYEYSAVLHGFAANMSKEAAAALAADPGVALVEPDGEMHITTTESGATWGIDRIDQRSLPLSGTYSYNTTGTGVRAYIIDTGIQTSHPQFGGRASAVYDALGGNGQDCNGHGTHVAGTVGSSTYGVAKNVYLRAVRVLDCNGSGSNSGVIAGMDWVRTNAIHPAVANMSLGGGYSSTVNTAATNLANSGVLLAVAAGNSAADACNSSPSSAPGTITVAASTSSDARASYSNYGGCVDIYAPGSSITSTWLNGGTNTISGTSMATPHVTGVAALYKSAYGDAATSTVISWLTGNATTGVISGNVSGTPNRLLYKSTL